MREETNERFKIHDTIISGACMIWAVISIVLMCYFTGENQVTFTIMTFGQLFLILGIIALTKRQVAGGIFTVTGLLSIILPAINEWGPLFNKNLTTFSLLPISISVGMVLVGLALLVVPGVLEDSAQRRCKVKVEAECVDLKSVTLSNSAEAYAPVYQYTYKDQVYDKCTEKYKTVNQVNIGDKIEFRINEKKPSEVYIEASKASLMIVYMVGVSFFITGIGMLITLLA